MAVFLAREPTTAGTDDGSDIRDVELLVLARKGRRNCLALATRDLPGGFHFRDREVQKPVIACMLLGSHCGPLVAAALDSNRCRISDDAGTAAGGWRQPLPHVLRALRRTLWIVALRRWIAFHDLVRKRNTVTGSETATVNRSSTGFSGREILSGSPKAAIGRLMPYGWSNARFLVVRCGDTWRATD